MIKLLLHMLGESPLALLERELKGPHADGVRPEDRALVAELREVGLDGASAVLDRYTVADLQAFHDSLYDNAVAAATAGALNLAIGLTFLHDVVCPYLAARRATKPNYVFVPRPADPRNN